MGSNWIKLDQTRSNWIQLDQTRSNWIKPDLTGSNWIAAAAVGRNHIKSSVLPDGGPQLCDSFNHCHSICDEAPPTTTRPAHRAHIRHVRPVPAGCGRPSPPPWTWRRPAAPSASPASCGWPAAPPGCRRSSPAGGDEEQRQFRHVFPISEGRLAELRRSIQRVGAPGDSRT